MSNLLEQEETVLKTLIAKALVDSKDKTVPDPNPLFAVRVGGVLVSIETEHETTNDTGYGHCTEEYLLTLVLEVEGVRYKATIKSAYDGGSCECCDDITYCIEHNEGHTYIVEVIKRLRFNTFEVIGPVDDEDDEGGAAAGGAGGRCVFCGTALLNDGSRDCACS